MQDPVDRPSSRIERHSPRAELFEASSVLTGEQQRHIHLMRSIAQRVTDTAGDALILKGGTALLLNYGLPRFSVDLDYDGVGRSVPYERIIRQGAADAGLTLQQLTLKKKTETTERYMVHYDNQSILPLKFEVSNRNASLIRDAPSTTENGIRSYAISSLASLKIDAFVNRTKARDIYDVSFLVEYYFADITLKDLTRISNVVEAEGIDRLAETMASDELLQAHDAVAIALALAENLASREK